MLSHERNRHRRPSSVGIQNLCPNRLRTCLQSSSRRQTGQHFPPYYQQSLACSPAVIFTIIHDVISAFNVGGGQQNDNCVNATCWFRLDNSAGASATTMGNIVQLNTRRTGGIGDGSCPSSGSFGFAANAAILAHSPYCSPFSFKASPPL